MPATVQFSAATLSTTVYEGNPVALSTVTLTGAAGIATVQYTTSNLSAFAGTDYTATSGTLTFLPGQTTKSIDVPILGGVGDSDNACALTLFAPRGAALGSAPIQTVTFFVTDPVSVTTPGDQSNYDGDIVNVAISASDALGNALSFSETGLPSGLSINSSGVIVGTIASDADAGGPYSVTVSATENATGVSASQTFSWAVAQPTITLTSTGDQSNYDGDAVSLSVAGSEDAGHSLAWSATGLPPGLIINSSTGVISGTVASDADTGGPYSVTVTAADGAVGVSASQTIEWNVAAVFVSLAAPGDQVNNDGYDVGLDLNATDSAGHTLTFTAAGLPPGLHIGTSSGDIWGTIAENADEESPYEVTITASDASAGVCASQEIGWAVEDTAPAVWGNATPLSVLRNQFTEVIDLSQYSAGVSGDDMVYTIVDQPANGQLYPLGGGDFDYISSPTFVGADSFTFQATDGSVTSASTATFNLEVTNDAPTASNTGTYYALVGQTITISDLGTYGNSLSTQTLTPNIEQGPTYGQLIPLGNGSYQYTAPCSPCTDSFRFSLSDGVAASNVVTATIQVVDQPIVANNVNLPNITGNEPIVITPAELLANAQSQLSNPSWQVVSLSVPQNGQLVVNGDGTWTYTPPADLSQQDAMSFTIADGSDNTASAQLIVFAPVRNRPAPDPNAPLIDRANWMQQMQQGGVGLYPPVGPNPDTVRQGFRSDGMDAAMMMSALQKNGFAWLQSTIRPRGPANQPPTSYQVLFLQRADGETYGYAEPDDNTSFYNAFQIYGCTTDGSLWFTVYDWAYADYLTRVELPNQQRVDVEPYTQYVTSAANLRQTARSVGGLYGSMSFNVANLSQRPSALSAALRAISNYMVGAAATLPSFNAQQAATAANNPGIVAGAAYAVLEYDPQNNKIKLGNPRQGVIGPATIDISIADFGALFGTLVGVSPPPQ